jgi:hypothetical protein
MEKTVTPAAPLFVTLNNEPYRVVEVYWIADERDATGEPLNERVGVSLVRVTKRGRRDFANGLGIPWESFSKVRDAAGAEARAELEVLRVRVTLTVEPAAEEHRSTASVSSVEQPSAATPWGVRFDLGQYRSATAWFAQRADRDAATHPDALGVPERLWFRQEDGRVYGRDGEGVREETDGPLAALAAWQQVVPLSLTPRDEVVQVLDDVADDYDVDSLTEAYVEQVHAAIAPLGLTFDGETFHGPEGRRFDGFADSLREVLEQTITVDAFWALAEQHPAR